MNQRLFQVQRDSPLDKQNEYYSNSHNNEKVSCQNQRHAIKLDVDNVSKFVDMDVVL